jgi:5-methylcytosine-specific restriction endonuclease McrA
MDRTKLAESIEAFKHYYLLDRSFYDKDERAWKEELRGRFQPVFAYDNVTGSSFLDSLSGLFGDKGVTKTIVLLCGGAHYQCQWFQDLLQSDLDQRMLSELFVDFLYSGAPVGERINRFKRAIDALYKKLARGRTIQLSLISQFLGLTFPDQYYIYKYTEFNQAVKYFEYNAQRADHSTGADYEYYFGLCREIMAAMNAAGLHDVDFIDVQTFVYRVDWYTPTDPEKEKDRFEEETAKQEALPTEQLVKRVREASPKPTRVVHGIYYYRDPNIAALVKRDARGICDLCSERAPFENREGKPYLENHHIVYLGDGGEDRVDNCTALCPNCHAKMHVLNPDSDRQRLLDVARARYERLFLFEEAAIQ